MKEQNYVRHVPTKLQQFIEKCEKGEYRFKYLVQGLEEVVVMILLLQKIHCTLDTAHLTLHT